MIMGPPFVKEHPQTKMTIYAVAELAWSETFEQSWKQTVEYYTKDRGDQANEQTKAEHTAASSSNKNDHRTGRGDQGGADRQGDKYKDPSTHTERSTGQGNTIPQPAGQNEQRKSAEL